MKKNISKDFAATLSYSRIADDPSPPIPSDWGGSDFIKINEIDNSLHSLSYVLNDDNIP